VFDAIRAGQDPTLDNEREIELVRDEFRGRRAAKR